MHFYIENVDLWDYLPAESLKALEKLKRQLAEAEAEAELEARKKPLEDAGPTFIGEGLVIDEWVWYLLIL